MRVIIFQSWSVRMCLCEPFLTWWYWTKCWELELSTCHKLTDILQPRHLGNTTWMHTVHVHVFVLFIHSRGIARIHSRALYIQTQIVDSFGVQLRKYTFWPSALSWLHNWQGCKTDSRPWSQPVKFLIFRDSIYLEFFQKKPRKCLACLFDTCLTAATNQPGWQRANK